MRRKESATETTRRLPEVYRNKTRKPGQMLLMRAMTHPHQWLPVGHVKKQDAGPKGLVAKQRHQPPCQTGPSCGGLAVRRNLDSTTPADRLAAGGSRAMPRSPGHAKLSRWPGVLGRQWPARPFRWPDAANTGEVHEGKFHSTNWPQLNRIHKVRRCIAPCLENLRRRVDDRSMRSARVASDGADDPGCERLGRKASLKLDPVRGV